MAITDWTENTFETRADLLRATQAVVAPLLPRYTPAKSGIRTEAFGAHFDDRAAELEGFSRVMWAVGAAAAGGDAAAPVMAEVVANFVAGLDAGTDPASDGYWDVPDSCDQRLVEMAALGFCLFMSPQAFWEPLSTDARARAARWLYTINEVGIVDNNWLFFRVFVNLGLRAVGERHDMAATKAALDRIEEFYLEDGWYYDGTRSQRDYYIPFAFHYYGLIYSTVMAAEDGDRCERFRVRAARFADDFYAYFDPDGSALPFGRSLTYRFAQGAFWSAMAYAGLEGAERTAAGPVVSTAVIKRTVLNHLRFWAKQPFLNGDGTFSVGYAYPNLLMSEQYNSSNSPYWAFKTMLLLALPENSAFWQCPEAPESTGPRFLTPISSTGQIVVNDSFGHTYSLAAGQFSDWLREREGKYSKFAYSCAFGVSVSSSTTGLRHYAADSYAVFSDDGGANYIGPGVPAAHGFVDLAGAKAVWTRWQDNYHGQLSVQTWLVPPTGPDSPWHTRVHKVESRAAFDIIMAEGGFAVSSQRPERRPIRDSATAEGDYFLYADDGCALVRSPSGVSGIVSTAGLGESYQTLKPDPNTNLLFPRSVVPTVVRTITPGTHWISVQVFAMPKAAAGWATLWTSRPDVGRLVAALS
ncbi:uncharacterized protein V1510DRAFT_395554 [Dipodascopsis tothii]|uniref:uncharacterized protein n=1 Tax=Dipodascopsis tothii TaxID=44089 RepID=UPI0034CFDB9F